MFETRLLFEVGHTLKCPMVAVSGMTGGGGIKSSQIFKRRASGVTAEIEAKYYFSSSSPCFVTVGTLRC